MAYSAFSAVPEHYRRQFQNQWDQQVQQMESRFKVAGIIDSSWTAKEKVFSDLNIVEWHENNSRFGKTNAEEIDGGKRKGIKRKFNVARKFDRTDKEFLEQMGLPDSEVMQAMRAGWERKLDDVFIDAAGADSLGGVEPYITPVPFPNSQVIPVNYVKPQAALGSNSGLTFWKVAETKARFERLDLDLSREELFLAISPDEEQQLLLQAESAPNDVWAKAVFSWYDAVARGQDAKLLGLFKVIKSNRLPVNAGTDIRTCYAFTRKAFTMSSDSFEIKIDILPTENHSLQIAGYAHKGVFRRYDERVVAIPCDRSP